jgi:hypothetical protein
LSTWGASSPTEHPITVSFGPESPNVGDFPWYAVPVRDIGKVGRPTYITSTGRDDRTELMRVPIEITGPNPEMEMKGDEPIEIALSDAKHSLILADLKAMRAIIGSVVEAFRPRLNI